LDFQGSFGLNQHFRFDEWRLYEGFKLGFINRFHNVHPMIGFEGGIEYYFGKWYIGAEQSFDLRTEYKTDFWRGNTKFKIGIVL
jgi:hypothetical protein